MIPSAARGRSSGARSLNRTSPLFEGGAADGGLFRSRVALEDGVPPASTLPQCFS
jgi:hypothetical protein